MSTIKTPRDLFERLFVPFDESLKKTKKQGGQSISFVEWTSYIGRAWKDFPEGFSTSIRDVTTIGNLYKSTDKNTGEQEDVDDRQVVVVVRVTDEATGIHHEATGAAPVSKTKAVWGGALPEAESQALRRAFAHFGLGLEMYYDDNQYEAVVGSEETQEDPDIVPPTEAQVERLRQLVAILEAQDEDYTDWIEQARTKVAEAANKKKVAGVVIRKLKGAMALAEIEVPEEDEDPS